MASLSRCLEPPIKPCLGVIWGWKLLPHEQLKAGRVTGPPCHTLSFSIKIRKGDTAANFPWALSIPWLRGEEGVIGVNCLIMIIATVWGKEQPRAGARAVLHLWGAPWLLASRWAWQKMPFSAPFRPLDLCLTTCWLRAGSRRLLLVLCFPPEDWA